MNNRKWLVLIPNWSDILNIYSNEKWRPIYVVTILIVGYLESADSLEILLAKFLLVLRLWQLLCLF
ncbi:MAG: hypothetical protein ACRD8Z_29080, partial [Nitrososphaeraceae archaeon]